MLRRFENKTALITGGAGGIGLAISRRFSSEGAAVVIADINATTGPAAERELRSAGAIAHFVEMDLGRAEDTARTVDTALDLCGRIDILVNCAAVLGDLKPITEITYENWERVIRTNLTGTFLLTQAVVRHMLARGGGVIVNILAIQPLMPLPEYGAYIASKGGLSALNRALAVELADKGIRVNGIAVGSVLTEGSSPALGNAVNPPTAALVGRMGRPEDIAAVAVWLASDDASYLAGAIIPADGGRLISRKPDPFLTRRS
jgi:NAD(P)-dependent dehydrogenase (short-subunit alcohol dehydrogenase family)